MKTETGTCEVCGAPGEPSWDDHVLCENCYGTIGATCAGMPRKKPAVDPDGTPPAGQGPVC